MKNSHHGSYFMSHPLFSIDLNVLQLLFYYDGFEVTKVLHSKTMKHHGCT